MRRRSRFVAATVAFAVSISGAATVATTTAASANAPAATPAAGAYTALPPTRILNTRTNHHPLAGHGTLDLAVTGHGGVPATNVAAVVLNLTAVNPTAAGFLTMYPQGVARPVTSNLNFVAGPPVANLVSSKLGATGQVSIYNGSGRAVDVIADVAGYITGGTPDQPGMFAALDPVRLVDTRHTSPVAAHSALSLAVTGHGGVPTGNVSAVALTLTTTGSTSSGYLTAYPHGGERPIVSNLNFNRGQTVANLVVVPVGTDGTVDFYNGSSGTTQVIVDIAGYYTGGVPATEGSFGALTPTRVLDTRGNSVVGEPHVPVAAHGSTTVRLQTLLEQQPLVGRYAAAVLNLTVTNTAAGGFVTAYPDGTTLGTASNINFGRGQTVANLVEVKAGANGAVRVYNGSSAPIDLIADVAGIYLDGTTGVVAGTVTDSGGHPVSGVRVFLAPPGGGGQAGFARTAADGRYQVFGVTPGQYQVCYYVSDATHGGDSQTGYLNQCYDGVATGGTPTPVTVTAGQATTAIDASLANAGAITGKVTDSAGHPLAHVQVGATTPPSAGPGNYTTATAADGTFTIKNLASGQYSVCFDVYDNVSGGTSTTGYVAECFDDTARDGTPTPVTVTVGAAPAVANASLATAGAISGKVTDSAGHPVKDVQVQVGPNFAGTAATAADGTYTIRDLAPRADYQVCFDPSGLPGSYESQCYNDVPDGGTPTPVTVTAGQTHTGINAKLSAGASISGRVTDSAGHGLGNVFVDIESATGDTPTLTGGDGSYGLGGLKAGTYTVCFSLAEATGGNSDATGYVDQCYNNVRSGGTPTPVTLAAGQARTGINAKAAAGGAISGTVTDSAGHPIALTGVTATDASGTFSQVGQTDQNGKYVIRGLPAGNFSVCFDGTSDGSGLGYLPECYNNIPPDGTPTPVSVTVGHTHAGINAALASGGAISGRVTDSAGHPIANVQVSAQTPDGTGYQTAITDDNGDYTVGGLTSGSYQVCFSSVPDATDTSSTGYAAECYDNVPPGGSATPVVVTGGQTTSGIDASLEVGAAVSGKVTDSAGHPLGGVSIFVQQPPDNPSWFGQADTQSDGTYRVVGIPAGSTTLCFDPAFTNGTSPTGYLSECYDNVPNGGTPTTFPLTAGENKTGMDADLATAGAISGKVTHTNGTAYPDATVTACGTITCAGGTSGVNGAYQINGLATDDYHICFDSPDGSVEKCLPNAVHVNAGAVTSNVNGGPGN